MGWAQRANDARRDGRTNWPLHKRPDEPKAWTLGALGKAIEAQLAISPERTPIRKREYRRRLALRRAQKASRRANR